MSFLFDAHHLGLRETGNETWERNLAAALETEARAGEVEYAVASEGLAELGRVTSAPAHVVSASGARRLAFDLPRLARRLASEALLVTYAAPLTRRPVVLLVHDVAAWYPEARDWLRLPTRVRYRATIAASWRRASWVVAPSEATRDDLVRRAGVPPQRVRVAPGAVDSELAGLLATARRARPPGGSWRVLAVGNVLPRKNLVVLARAVRACNDRGVPVTLRIVGAVPPAGQAEAARIRALLGPAVETTGYVSRPDLAAEYADADAFCFPSRLEGFGVPVLEAMAAGTPVVVADTPVLREVAGPAALACPVDDPGAWCHTLLRLREDKSLQDRLRRLGQRRVTEFSWSRSAGVVLDALRSAAAGTGGTARPGAGRRFPIR